MDVQIGTAVEHLEKNGFLDVAIDSTLDLFAEIEKNEEGEECCSPGALLPGT